MRSLQLIIIPGIIVGLIGGVILFFAAYNFYPHKNVNINLNGSCYEFLGNAYAMYTDLENAKEKELLRMQIEAIENPDALVPITFSGSQIQVDSLINSSKLSVTSKQTLGDNQTYVDKVIVKAVAKLSFLQHYYERLNSNETENVMAENNLKIGILPNEFISPYESNQIIDATDKFMVKGIKEILSMKEGVKSTECRSTIVYQDS